MKKFTLLLMSLLMVSIFALAQKKLCVHTIYGEKIEYIASDVAYIDFEGNNEQPDIPEDMPMLNAPGKDSVTIAIHVPENTCNGVILVGAGVGPDGTDDWSPADKNNPFKQVPAELANGDDRWYSITIAHNDALAVKAIALNQDGEVHWSTQWGRNIDFEEENVIILQGTAYIDNTENSGEVKLTGIEAGSVVYVDVKAWKSTPCVETNKAGFAKIIATLPEVPEGYVVGVVGSFGGYVVDSFGSIYVEDPTKFWNLESGVFPMTKGADGKYTVELEVPDECEFKILLSADGTTWDWDLGADNGNFIMDLDLVSEVEVTAWKGLLDE